MERSAIVFALSVVSGGGPLRIWCRAAWRPLGLASVAAIAAEAARLTHALPWGMDALHRHRFDDGVDWS